jgi:pyridoxal phosphate enzyme (YggS family)
MHAVKPHHRAHEQDAPPATFAQLEDRYAAVRQRIADAASRSGRQPADVLLVAVTKHADPEHIRRLVELGHRDFGENRAQQLVQRAAMMDEFLARLNVVPSAGPVAGLRTPGAAEAASRGVRWHMIGHLQRNKARKVVELCRLIHSVDSLRLAEELQQIALRRNHVVEVLVQVNCSGETQKFGCPIPAVLPLIEQIETMVNIRVRGLMTMAPYADNPELSRPCFARCREIFEEIRREGVGEGRFNLLSMGMSGDYEVAVSEGSNIVRVGSSIFGEPAHPEPADDADEPDEA